MNCTICIQNVTNNNRVVTNCNHVFHFSCILKNYLHNYTSGHKCPLCREALMPPRIPVNQVISSSSGPTNIPTDRPTNIPTVTAIRYPWPPILNPFASGIRNNKQIFTRLKTRKYRNITEITRVAQLDKYADIIVNKYSYADLKELLVRYGLPRRGYRRVSLEKKLTNHMKLSTTILIDLE